MPLHSVVLAPLQTPPTPRLLWNVACGAFLKGAWDPVFEDLGGKPQHCQRGRGLCLAGPNNCDPVL